MAGRLWIVAGAFLAGVAVTAGAVGTHFLKEKLQLPEADLANYETAARYQMYHALGLMLVGLLSARGLAASRLCNAAGTLFLLGIVLFSGGLYGWIFTAQKPFVHVVPIGGMAWIIGWLVLAIAALRTVPSPSGRG